MPSAVADVILSLKYCVVSHPLSRFNGLLGISARLRALLLACIDIIIRLWGLGRYEVVGTRIPRLIVVLVGTLIGLPYDALAMN